MPRLRDLTKHPFPDEITPDLIDSVTISTLDKWITEKELLASGNSLKRMRRSEKESLLLCWMSVSLYCDIDPYMEIQFSVENTR
jgi:hypothetical protein